MFDAETTSELRTASATLDQNKSVVVWHKMFYKHIRSLGPVFTGLSLLCCVVMTNLRFTSELRLTEMFDA